MIALEVTERATTEEIRDKYDRLKRELIIFDLEDTQNMTMEEKMRRLSDIKIAFSIVIKYR